MCVGVEIIGCVTFFSSSVKCTIAIIWCPSSVNFHILIYFSQTTGPVGIKLDTNFTWLVLIFFMIFIIWPLVPIMLSDWLTFHKSSSPKPHMGRNCSLYGLLKTLFFVNLKSKMATVARQNFSIGPYVNENISFLRNQIFDWIQIVHE